MKELSIEQKAKAYDKALDRAKKVHKYSSDLAEIKRMEEIFPELKESEDEKIMKALIEYFNEQCDMSDWNGVYGYQVVNWLEKVSKDNKFLKSIKVGDIITKSPDGILINLGQSDKDLEHHDKFEPKFKVGDWVVFNNKHQSIYHIEKIEDGYYILRHTHGGTFRVCVLHDESLRLWTIQDAKTGDVLIDHCDDYKNPLIFILRKFERVDFGLAQKSDYSSYCFLTAGDKQRFKEGMYHHKHNIKPATKEQRDILFAKMREDGYTWNCEKKELKQIEQKPMLSDFFNAEYERGKADALKSIEWSEEDKDYYDAIIAKLEVTQDDAGLTDNQMEFLKSLKQRIGG